MGSLTSAEYTPRIQAPLQERSEGRSCERKQWNQFSISFPSLPCPKTESFMVHSPRPRAVSSPQTVLRKRLLLCTFSQNECYFIKEILVIFLHESYPWQLHRGTEDQLHTGNNSYHKSSWAHLHAVKLANCWGKMSPLVPASQITSTRCITRWGKREFLICKRII